MPVYIQEMSQEEQLANGYQILSSFDNQQAAIEYAKKLQQYYD